MPSLLLIPLGLVVWMLCYGPGVSYRRQENGADWQQATTSAPNQETELTTLLAVEEPDSADRES